MLSDASYFALRTISIRPMPIANQATVLLNEPLSLNLVAGIVTVFAGIRIATTTGRRAVPA